MSWDVRVTVKGEDRFVELNGVLDEEARLPAVNELGRGRVTVDLAGVQLINSLGCRAWMNWIDQLAKQVEDVRLERCSFAVVQQINILTGFVPRRARVGSFFVPYECARCGHGARVLHRLDADFHADAVPDGLDCAACGDRMTLEIIRPAYFKFLTLRAA